MSSRQRSGGRPGHLRAITHAAAALAVAGGALVLYVQAAAVPAAAQGAPLTVTKTASATQFSGPGQRITYTFTATNTGSAGLRDISVTDTSNGATKAVCHVTALAPGHTLTCTATHVTTMADVDRGRITDTASATARTFPGNVPVTSAPVTLTISLPPSISITKTASPEEFSGPGQRISYTFIATNTGRVRLHDITVTDTSDGVATVVCHVTALAPGHRLTCTATHVTTAEDVLARSLTDTATVSAVTADGTTVTGEPSSVTVTFSSGLVTDVNTGESFPNLQGAVHAAANGDTLSISGTVNGTTRITNKELTIVGDAGATLNGERLGAVLDITGGHVTLKALNITNGFVAGSGSGGGIDIQGARVNLDDSTVSGNEAGYGGGISNDGTVYLDHGSAVTGNTARFGGGIDNAGTVTLNHGSKVTDNHADGDGGGINSTSGTVTLLNSSAVTGNSADSGGGINSANTTLFMEYEVKIDGNTASDTGGGIRNVAGKVTLDDGSTVKENTAAGNGGGVFNDDGSVTLNDRSTITKNTARHGGGVFNSGTGTVTLMHGSTVTGNTPDDIAP